MSMTLTWPLSMAKVKYKYTDRKSLHDFLYDDNINIYTICQN